MAYEFYVKIEGTTQGPFKGESGRTSRAEWLTGLSFAHSIKSPRDVATGRASGKRQHGPITFTKEWGASTPQLMQALCTNEMLPSVAFEFIHTNDMGQEEVYYKITLTNATVSAVNYNTGAAGASEASARTTSAYDTMEVEAVSLTYQKIVHEQPIAGTVAIDDWAEQGGA
jgi:type VI secretion system secreted protein Hcp